MPVAAAASEARAARTSAASDLDEARVGTVTPNFLADTGARSTSRPRTPLVPHSCSVVDPVCFCFFPWLLAPDARLGRLRSRRRLNAGSEATFQPSQEAGSRSTREEGVLGKKEYSGRKADTVCGPACLLPRPAPHPASALRLARALRAIGMDRPAAQPGATGFNPAPRTSGQARSVYKCAAYARRKARIGMGILRTN